MQDRDPCGARGVDDIPLGLIVIQKSFKVRDEDHSVIPNCHIKVTVVGMVVIRGEDLDEGDAL
jgi:hypothetical protein